MSWGTLSFMLAVWTVITLTAVWSISRIVAK